MKKLIMFVCLLGLISCSSTYKVSLESPISWYKRNAQEKNNDEESMPSVSKKLQDLKYQEYIENRKTESEIKENKLQENKFDNISETRAYGEENFFTKPKSDNKIENVQYNYTKQPYNENEENLIRYISQNVLENKNEIENLIEEGYNKIKNYNITREEFIAICTKIIVDKKINNFSYVVSKVISSMGE